MAGHSAGQRSSLEEMLETLRGIDEMPYDVPPALPARPKSKARLPSKVKSRKGMLSLQAAAQPTSGLSVLNTDQMPHRNQKGADSMQDNGFSTPGKRYPKSDSQGFSKIERGKISENGSSTSGNRKSRPQKLSRRHPVIEGTFSLESSNTGSKNLMEAQSVSESPYKEKKNPFEIDDYDMVSASPLSRERSHKWDDVGASSIKKESRAWCVMSESEWALGTILTTSGIESFLSLSNGKTIKMETSKLLPANPEILEGVDDLIQLSYLNEPSVLHSLQHRYFQDMIYTKAGPVLIAVNPFKNVPIFGNEYIEVYRQKSRDSPHVYQMADAAFEAMMQEGVNQSIIISGESGAGKTETAKKAMQYFAGLGGGSGIENEILQTNPILEAFGNAKTSRNNNSSRFGKLIDIHFDDSGRICGANIQTYLLEKSRVVKQTKGERSYHIFYQFCAGASPSLRERLNLMPAEKYFYLNQGDCLTIEEVDDAKNFQGVMEALNVVEISKEDQENVFAMLAAVLWLGNIEFSVSDCENYVEVESNEGVKNAAKLLGCDAVALMRALSTRKIRAGNEDIIQRLTKAQAIDTRDALAKAVYACLFDWLVGRINKSLEVGKHCTGRSISILDIYGFESFEKNSFEQLCINYANERLQQHFNRHLFKLEQEEYNLDGIDWTKVDFIDNQECLDLIEKKPLGVLSLLDEECTFPKGTDLTLANKLKQHLSLNTCFKGERGRCFRINHYAGEVTYDTATFLEKNRDLLHSDLIHLLSSCFGLANSFISNLQRSEHKPPTPRGRLAMVDIQKQSVATKFKGQLFKLMQRLESTSPHFIRCIKPNKSLLPGLFEQSLILQQLRSCGVLEVIRISRSGYPTRMLHQHFAKRYGFLLPPNAAGQDALNVTVAILHQFGILPEMYQIGFTKLFLRSGQLGRLEEIRSKTILGILGVQKVFRGYRTRNQIKKQKRSILCLQSYIRGEESRRKYQELTKRCKAAITIQTVIRQKVAQKGFRNARTLVIGLQSVIRSFMVRQSLWKQIKMDEETSDVKVVVRESISDKISDVRESVSDKTSDVSESFSDKTADVKESISDKTSDVTKESIVDRITNENEELYTEMKSIGYAESKSIGVINSLPKTKKRLPLKELKFPDQEFENDGTIRVRASYLAELQRRVLEAESLLREKEDDNLLLQQKLYQHESRWSEYESKMTSMEEVWQKQMASLQMSLVAAKKTLVEETFHHPAKQEEFLAYNQSSVPKVKTSKTILPQEDNEFDWDDSTSVGTKTSEYKQRSVNSDSGLARDLDGGKSAVGELVQEFEHRTQIFTDDADFLVEVKAGLTEATNINPDSELRKLKQTFDAWKKDFKLRLREVKNTLQKCGNENYTDKTRKKWWGKRNS